jgi:hypothetical protein
MKDYFLVGLPLKFSIRDLLLVTVIVALAVAWWVDRARLAEPKFSGGGGWRLLTLPNSSAPALNPPNK